MVGRHGAALLRVANQFSLCHDDALDAYQRGLEIYLRRLDTVDPATEGAWLRVVVKHEAMAIRSARQASVDREDVDLDERVPAGLRAVEDEVAGGERVERSVEALKALKPDEARALLLKAEGLSYDEIGRRFGWTYTKVNRSIAEGRKRFLKVYSGIESGEACSAHEEVLDALVAGTATSAQLVSLRPHLRHCATCRATVRDLRFSRRRRFALLAPFGWLARLLNRSDVIQYAASGGGRLGPAATLIGLCLGGAGAGAACMVTGALPAPAIIARVEANSTPAPVAKKKARPHVVKHAVKPTMAPSPRYTTAVASATRTPVPPKPAKARTSRKPATHKVVAKKKSTEKEWGFENDAPSDSATTSAPLASAASAGGGGSSSNSSGGGGGGHVASTPPSKSSKEFG